MKILIIGMDLKYNAEFFYKKAFEKLGHEIILLDEYKNIKNPFITRILHTRTGLFNHSLKNLTINKNLSDFIYKKDPDKIIIFKGELLSTDNINKISENYDLYLYYPDTYRFKKILKNRLQSFKAVFTAANRLDFYYKLGAKKAITIPWGCDPEFHRKLNIEKIYKLSFIGTWYFNRGRIINKLDNVYVFGNYWLRKNKFPPVYGEELIKTINKTLINLNLHHTADIKADAPNMRTFELSGCGAFQITNAMDSIKKYFKSMPTFNDIYELKELIDYYSNANNELNEISLKNQEICYKNYKYTDSAKKIIENF